MATLRSYLSRKEFTIVPGQEVALGENGRYMLGVIVKKVTPSGQILVEKDYRPGGGAGVSEYRFNKNNQEMGNQWSRQHIEPDIEKVKEYQAQRVLGREIERKFMELRDSAEVRSTYSKEAMVGRRDKCAQILQEIDKLLEGVKP